MSLEETFAKRLHEALWLSGMKSKDLCRKVGISEPTLSGYLHKRNSPTLWNVAKIAEVLDISIDWLCGLSNDHNLP